MKVVLIFLELFKVEQKQTLAIKYKPFIFFFTKVKYIR